MIHYYFNLKITKGSLVTMATNLLVEWQLLGCWSSCCFQLRSLLELAPRTALQMLGSLESL